MNTIAMKVNQANLVKSLKFSFTNRSTVLSEMMQNSRRAKAAQVVFDFTPDTQTLRVIDDGCGIDSIETLLTVAESGWDAEVMAHDHPFGIGFISALFACRHITVVSKSGCLSADTADILSFLPVAVTSVDDWDGKTCITLLGVGLDEKDIEATLKKLAQGFPIPVLYNGNVLERQYALDSGLQFVSTDIGDIHLVGVDAPNGAPVDFEVYLQGLPIYSSYQYRFHTVHIVHLDSSRFYARLPDRDKLINEAEVVGQVKAALKLEIEKHFIGLKVVLSDEEFIEFYPMIKQWGLLRLFNDTPLVPKEVLSEFVDYPVCDSDVYGGFYSPLNMAMTRAEVEALGVVIIDDAISYDGAARYLFARAKNHLLYHDGLDKGHWIQPLVRHLSEQSVSVETVGESHSACFKGEWMWVNVRFCESYQIQIGADVVEISHDGLYTGQDCDDEVILPKGDASPLVLKQISNYKNEFEEFQGSTHESDLAAMTAFIVANTTRDPADAMLQLLPSFSGCPSLQGKSFVVTLDNKGEVASVLAT